MSKPISLTLNAESELAFRRFRRILDNSRVTIKSVHRNPDSMIVRAEERDGDVVRDVAYYFCGKSARPLIARNEFRKVTA